MQGCGNSLGRAISREMTLEDLCAKETSETVQLNHLKHERECNSIIAQTREDKILHLQSFMDGILLTEDCMEDELFSLKHEHEERGSVAGRDSRLKKPTPVLCTLIIGILKANPVL